AYDNGDLLSLAKRKYLYVEEGKKTNYLYCTYTSSSTYDEEGAPVMVTLTTNQRYTPTKATCSFIRKDSEGATYEHSVTMKIDRDENDNDIEIFDYVLARVPEVIGVKDYRIKNIKGNKSIEDILLSGHSRFEQDRTYYSNRTYYAYGVINGENDTKLYKIYPMVTKINEIKERKRICKRAGA
ncbi:MAG: hypothetical protein IIY09_02405, partial [Clostridia bacterium]|nr:hypothetical protein [Clostridia bacterium]